MATTRGTVSTKLGTIQKYFEDAWMEMPEEDFRTPLASSEYLEEALLPAHRGQYCEFRKFADLDVAPASTSDDTPLTYAENSEPTTNAALETSVIQVPLEILSAYVSLGDVEAATDPVDLVRKNKEALQTLIRRQKHMLANSHLVKQLTRVLSGSVPAATTYLPKGFRVIYAGGTTTFGEVTKDSVFTMLDFKRGRMFLANGRVPRFKSKRFVAVIDEAIQAQLIEDPVYSDAVKRHEDKWQMAHVQGRVASVEGLDFVVQDDPYRCDLAAAAGAVTSRQNDGAVHCAHIFGKGAAGYVPFGGAKTLQRTKASPRWKVTDTSNTGTGPNIGYRLPYQAAVLDRARGINLFGCSHYDETLDDLLD